MLTISRRQLCLVILLLGCAPTVARAQVGRIFVSVEAFVGLARIVHVGKIVELKAIEYDKPLTPTQKIGKPYRLVFEVSETIRGKSVERLELVLSLQSTYDLDCLREQAAEIMLVGGPNSLRTIPRAEIGIEEQGERVDGEWYQFRLLEPLKVPESGEGAEHAADITKAYDSCRMFTSDLEIVQGRKAILERARAFAKEHARLLSGVLLMVPNDFGALVGSPNAYSKILLPVCPDTKKTLTALKDDPGRILSRIEVRDKDYNFSYQRAETEKALAEFESSDGE